MKLLMMMCNAWRGGVDSKTSNGRLMALASTEPVWLRLMIPRLGLIQTMDRKYVKVTRNDMVWETLYSVLKYVKKVEMIDIDEKGEPAFYVSYDDWINYVKNFDFLAIVFPTKRDFDYLDALERIGIMVKFVTEHEDIIIVLITECEKLVKAEYIAFVYGMFNALSERREILPTCVCYSKEEMHRHLEISFSFSEKYLGKWYE